MQRHYRVAWPGGPRGFASKETSGGGLRTESRAEMIVRALIDRGVPEKNFFFREPVGGGFSLLLGFQGWGVRYETRGPDPGTPASKLQRRVPCGREKRYSSPRDPPQTPDLVEIFLSSDPGAVQAPCRPLPRVFRALQATMKTPCAMLRGTGFHAAFCRTFMLLGNPHLCLTFRELSTSDSDGGDHLARSSYCASSRDHPSNPRSCRELPLLSS